MKSPKCSKLMKKRHGEDLPKFTRCIQCFWSFICDDKFGKNTFWDDTFCHYKKSRFQEHDKKPKKYVSHTSYCNYPNDPCCCDLNYGG
jgi:hypothetical protein